jgi:adenosylcobinamide amidohydrolase
LALVVDLGETYRCLSSAVLGGGLSRMRTWINQQVPPGYSRTDPREHLLECAHDLEPPVVGMLTAAPVSAYCDCAHGSARAVATVEALAEARIPALNADVFATGTATDSFCIACPEGQGSPFAGTATRVGGDIAQAVHGALLEGALRYRAPAPEAMGGRC